MQLEPDRSATWQERLLTWYRAAKRDLPWRRTRDPYAVWVSEVMLQQTQIATALPYYERWMQRFPDVHALAKAHEQEALSLWQGLGYYRRCRMLLEGARTVANAGFPESAEAWQGIPGVGRYTAGAIASICLNEPTPVVDGNVERVFARLTGNTAEGPELHRSSWEWAAQHVDPEHPGDWNQALMELGATICRPVKPACTECPVREACIAYHSGRVHELPRRRPSKKVVRIHETVWVPWCYGRFGVRQIGAGQWWEGLWEFPRAGSIESLQELLPDVWPELLGEVRHSVTHHRIRLSAYLARCESQTRELTWVSRDRLQALPMPAPQRRILRLVTPYLDA